MGGRGQRDAAAETFASKRLRKQSVGHRSSFQEHANACQSMHVYQVHHEELPSTS
jgi:hypothetical protein